MEQYRYERLNNNNLQSLVYLYKYCFNHVTSLDFLTKKYATEVFGAKFIGYLAIEINTNQVAGYYGVFPIICIKNGTKILAGQSGDTMTHPQHQGKGIFTILANKTYQLAKLEKIQFIFGFPNANSFPGFVKKLNWKHYADVNNFTIATGMIPFDKIVKKIPFFERYYSSFLKKVLQPYFTKDLIKNSLANQIDNYGYILHDDLFYSYKKYNTIYRIQLKYIKCVIKIDGRLWIGDMEPCDEANFLEIIEELVVLAKKLGCSSIQFSVFNQSLFDILLRKTYPIKSKNAVGCLALNEAIDPTKFAYQGLDFDTF
jgi:hypothetical protein